MKLPRLSWPCWRPGKPRNPAGPVPAIVKGDGAFTAATFTATAFVAVIAFSASYQHQYELSIRYGQTHWVAGMNPLSVDCLIVAAGLVIWYAARHRYPRPWGAWGVLVIGVAATVIANLAADHRYDWPWLGPGISAWPAFAFVASYEMAVWLVRKRQTARQAADENGDGSGPFSSAPPSDAETAAIASLRATLAAGNPWSLNQLSERFGLTRSQATKARTAVLAEANGHDHGTGIDVPDP
jgi:Protein of unknown function (DUF2637)